MIEWTRKVQRPMAETRRMIGIGIMIAQQLAQAQAHVCLAYCEINE